VCCVHRAPHPYHAPPHNVNLTYRGTTTTTTTAAAAAAAAAATAATTVVKVKYCSAKCQKKHWKSFGGHKKVCKAVVHSNNETEAQAAAEAKEAAAATVAAAKAEASKVKAAAATAVAATDTSSARIARLIHSQQQRAGAAPNGIACVICWEGSPPPIQSGCACRGDAEWAHASCRMLAAQHAKESSASTDNILSYGMCFTCHQQFNGPMAVELAQGLLSRSQGRPSELNGWIFSTKILSNALLGEGEFVEAEAVCQDNLSSIDRMGLNTARYCLATVRIILGHSLTSQERHVEAQVVFEQCLTELNSRFGPDHEFTLDGAHSMGECLFAQGKNVRACTLLKDTLVRAKRVCGPESGLTLSCATTLGKVLTNQSKTVEALALYDELLPVLKRVFGPDHMYTMQATSASAISFANSGRFAKADAILVEILETKVRVLGANNASTVSTAQELKEVRAAKDRDAHS
jgi:hypothetical protein